MNQKPVIDYQQILELIHQLPEHEITKLTATLQKEELSGKKSITLKELLLQAPTWSATDFDNWQKARNYLNQSRIA
jgi:hypothetical protein